MLEQGGIESNVAKQVYRQEGKLPDAIENAPELLPGLFLYLQAFMVLERERQNGFSIGYIPRRAIKDYAEDYGFDEDQAQALEYHVKHLDTIRIKHDRKKQEDRAAQSPRRLKKR